MLRSGTQEQTDIDTQKNKDKESLVSEIQLIDGESVFISSASPCNMFKYFTQKFLA